MITVGTLGGNLKRKYVTKNKPNVKSLEAQFKEKHGREPITDSEIDQVYGAGAATKAMDDFYEKRKKK